jgi:hypothetical protein
MFLAAVLVGKLSASPASAACVLSFDSDLNPLVTCTGNDGVYPFFADVGEGPGIISYQFSQLTRDAQDAGGQMPIQITSTGASGLSAGQAGASASRST